MIRFAESCDRSHIRSRMEITSLLTASLHGLKEKGRMSIVLFIFVLVSLSFSVASAAPFVYITSF